MKKFRWTALVLILSAVFLSAQAGNVFANDMAKHGEGIKQLREAATALAPTNPALSAKLNAIADRKEDRMKKVQQHKDDIQAIKDASVALATTNPALSANLAKKAERMEQWKANGKHKHEESAEKATA